MRSPPPEPKHPEHGQAQPQRQAREALEGEGAQRSVVVPLRRGKHRVRRSCRCRPEDLLMLGKQKPDPALALELARLEVELNARLRGARRRSADSPSRTLR